MEPEISLRRSQEPTTGSEPGESSPHLPSLFLQDKF
jgi:hypothetical protein